MAYYQPAQAFAPDGAVHHRWLDPAPQGQQHQYQHQPQTHHHGHQEQYEQKGYGAQGEWPAVIERNELVWGHAHAPHQDQYEYASDPVPGGVPVYAEAHATAPYPHAQQHHQQDAYHHEYAQQPQYVYGSAQGHEYAQAHPHAQAQGQAPLPPAHAYTHYQHDGYAPHQQHQQHPHQQHQQQQQHQQPQQPHNHHQHHQQYQQETADAAYRAHIARAADAVLARGVAGASSSLLGDGSSCRGRGAPSRGGSLSSLDGSGGASPMKVEGGDEARFPTLLSGAPLQGQGGYQEQQKQRQYQEREQQYREQQKQKQYHEREQQYREREQQYRDQQRQEQQYHTRQPKQEYAEEQGYDDEDADGEYELEYPEHHYASSASAPAPSSSPPTLPAHPNHPTHPTHSRLTHPKQEPHSDTDDDAEPLSPPARIVPSQAHLPPPRLYQPFYQDHAPHPRRAVDPDAPFVSPLTAGIPPLTQRGEGKGQGRGEKLGGHASLGSGLGSIAIGKEREGGREGVDVGARVAAAGALRPEKKQALACLFCRERKIACGRPEAGSADPTCNQCARRHIECEYPKESRRGQHKRTRKRKAGEGEGHDVNAGRLLVGGVDLRELDEAE
ncbi:hypothetical protein HWV62_40832 [Athelia sp. TMB]|nr:hypothetical protein HWV62_40832 [Athelia sp. TMB]